MIPMVPKTGRPKQGQTTDRRSCLIADGTIGDTLLWDVDNNGSEPRVRISRAGR